MSGMLFTCVASVSLVSWHTLPEKFVIFRTDPSFGVKFSIQMIFDSPGGSMVIFPLLLTLSGDVVEGGGFEAVGDVVESAGGVSESVG